MITSVAVQDFQSLRDVELELGAFTVVVGPSNTGKSALLRALNALFFNQAGAEFISRGSKLCRVKVDFAEGASLQWDKASSGTAAYVLTDTDSAEQQFTKIGREIPDPVLRALNVRRIDIDGTRLTPQVARQFDSPFLLAETSTKAARVLANVTKLDVLLNALVAARRDASRQQSALTQVQKQIATKEELLADFTYLEQWEEQVNGWVARSAELREEEAIGQTLVAGNTKLAAVRRTVESSTCAVSSLDLDDVLLRAGRAVSVLRLNERYKQAALDADSSSSVDPAALSAVEEEAGQAVDFLRLQTRYRDSRRRCDTTEEEIRGASVTVKQLEEELASYGTCPTCGSLYQDSAI